MAMLRHEDLDVDELAVVHIDSDFVGGSRCDAYLHIDWIELAEVPVQLSLCLLAVHRAQVK